MEGHIRSLGGQNPYRPGTVWALAVAANLPENVLSGSTWRSGTCRVAPSVFQSISSWAAAATGLKAYASCFPNKWAAEN